MKIQSAKKTKTSRIIILAFIAILILGVGLAASYHFNAGPFANNSSSEVSQEEKDKANNSDQTNNQKKSSVKDGTTSENVDTTQTTDQIPASSDVSVSIKNLTHQDGIVSYTANVAGATHGTCSAVFTSQMGKPVNRTNDTSNGVCSASISEAEFDELGTWTLTLRFYSNNTQATASRDVVINS